MFKLLIPQFFESTLPRYWFWSSLQSVDKQHQTKQVFLCMVLEKEIIANLTLHTSAYPTTNIEDVYISMVCIIQSWEFPGLVTLADSNSGCKNDPGQIRGDGHDLTLLKRLYLRINQISYRIWDSWSRLLGNLPPTRWNWDCGSVQFSVRILRNCKRGWKTKNKLNPEKSF